MGGEKSEEEKKKEKEEEDEKKRKIEKMGKAATNLKLRMADVPRLEERAYETAKPVIRWMSEIT